MFYFLQALNFLHCEWAAVDADVYTRFSCMHNVSVNFFSGRMSYLLLPQFLFHFTVIFFLLEFLPPCFLVLLSVCSWPCLVLFMWQKKKLLYLPVVPSGSVGKEMLCLTETHLWKASQSGTTFLHCMCLRETV